MPRVSSKEKYIAQVYDIFVAKGLGLSMDEIAIGLGLTKKTLYNNFESKEDLIRTVVKYFYKGLEKKIEESIDNTSNAIEALFVTSRVIEEEVDGVGLSLIREMSTYRAHEHVLDHVNRMSFYAKLIKVNLLKGIAEGLYIEEIDIEYTTLFYTCAIERFYKWEGSYEFLESSSHFHAQLLKRHLFSITNTKGREVLEQYLIKKEI